MSILNLTFLLPTVWGQGVDCGTATDITADVSSDGYLNQSFDIPAVTLSSEDNPDCQQPSVSPNSPIATTDAWALVTPTSTGTLVVQYTGTEASNIDVTTALYTGTCAGLTLVRCANDQRGESGPETESFSYGVTSGVTYYIRIISTKPTASGATGGNLTVYQGNLATGDICSNAPEVSVGTCDYNFTVAKRFVNHEGRDQNTACAAFTFDPSSAGNNIDGWVRFTPNVSEKIGVEYTNINRDAALEIYSGSCGTMTFVGCVDGETGTGAEVLEFDAIAGTEYFVRIINIHATNGDRNMRGSMCIYSVYGRTDCSDLSATSSLILGDCNVKVNILQDTGPIRFDGDTHCGIDNISDDDTWLLYEHTTADSDVRLEYNILSDHTTNPEVIVYDIDLAAGFDCAGNINSSFVISCENAGAVGNKSVANTFSATQNHTYYIRLMKSDGAETLRGSICIYENALKAENFFYTAPTYAIDGSNCGETFNILGTYTLTSGLSNSCNLGSNPASDAWAKFQTGGTVTDLIIEYNNDNNDPSEANDVAVQVFEGPASTTVAPVDACAGANTIGLNETTTFNIPDSFTDSDLTCSAIVADEGWASFTLATSTYVYISYTNTDNDAVLSLGTGCASIAIACADNQTIGTEVIDPGMALSAGTYYIQVGKKTGGADMNGTLTLYTLSEVACVNSIISEEGTESITIPSTDLNPNTEYFIRVVNTTANTTSTTGTLCIRDNTVEDGDLCNTAIQMNVGDCDVSFDLGSDFTFDQPSADPVACSPDISSQRDGWIKFTATSSLTTIQYASANSASQNAALAVYRGSCGSNLIFQECTNEDPGSDIEEIQVTTIVGLQYFIRVMNVESDAAMTGRVCIFNTTERDVCDDADLVTRAVGDCNITFNVPASFSNTGATLRDISSDIPFTETRGSLIQVVASICDTAPNAPGGEHDVSGARDAWMRFTGDGNEVTLVYENKESSSDPAIVVYTALQATGPVDCSVGLAGAGNPLNQYACTNDTQGTGIQTESVTFQSEAGQRYIIRILDMVSPGTDMTGSLCISADDPSEYDICSTARSVEVGDCSVSLNVINGVSECTNDSDLNGKTACSAGTTGNFINFGSTWKYDATDTDYYTANTWKDPGFNDSSWSSGTGVLYYTGGDAPSCGSTDIGNVDPVVTYFRHDFTFSGAAPDAGEIHLAVDDAAVVYINGVEVYRTTNITSGTITHSTAATGHENGCTFETITLSVADLANINVGNNTVAVSVHNHTRYDITFGMELILEQVGLDCTTHGGDAWATFTVPSTLADDEITIQYDNRDFTLGGATDVKLSVYQSSAGCSFSNPGFTAVGCIDAVATGEEGIESLSISSPNPGDVYYIRIINNEPGKNVYGNLCLFWGETLADQNCPGENDYGSLDGEFKDFEVLGEFDNNTSTPSRTIDDPVPCVVPGGSNPASNSTRPIRSQAWMRFTVPANPGYNAVTVQYDNSGYEDNPQNAAIAIYTMPDHLTDVESGNCNLFDEITERNGVFLVSCINSVYNGAESLTFSLEGDDLERVYFVRVMNVSAGSGTVPDMPGRIRVFPFAECSEGPELVVDGDFANWPTIDDSSNPYASGVTNGSGNYESYMSKWVLTNPIAQDGTNAERNSFIETYPHFATDYGYIRNVGRNSGSQPGNHNSATNNHDYLANAKDEIREGLYAVSQDSWSYHSAFYCYGNGYTGYGGNTSTYCDSGSSQADSHACMIQTDSNAEARNFGSHDSDRPALIPPFADANYMIVNGSYNPDNDIPPGKVWCQTIDRGASAGNVGYYVYTVWVQNLISDGRNIDVPLLRMTVCDMEDPDNEGTFPAIGMGVQDSDGTNTRLPGVTTFLNGTTFHNPAVPNRRSYDLELAIVDNRGELQDPYGAASPCNLTGEARDHRIKILGSSFLVNEEPDQWSVIRCIYKAPAEVVKANICLENLSLTQNGNDFAIDDISFRECESADVDTFERLLKGDPCELATSPDALGIPLNVRMLDFNGNLKGRYVYLNWMVTMEQNASRYVIQRSVNGTDFQKIGSENARQLKNTVTAYDFIDKNIPEGYQYIYYRLKIYDTQDGYEYGNVIRIDVTSLETFEMVLAPNPVEAGQEAEVKFNVGEGQAQIEISNIMGRKLSSEIVETHIEGNTFLLDTKGLKTGIYLVSLTYQGRKVTKRLVVKGL